MGRLQAKLRASVYFWNDFHIRAVLVTWSHSWEGPSMNSAWYQIRSCVTFADSFQHLLTASVKRRSCGLIKGRLNHAGQKAYYIRRNETKRNETKRNETKRNETKRNETKRKVIFNKTNETSSISQKPLARSNRNHEIRVGGIDFHLWEWFLKETCPSEMNFEKFWKSDI